MQSANIVFTGPNRVEVRHEEVPSLAPGQILVETQVSLISTGTEGIALAGKFEPGSHWDKWVRYPFYPGYNNVGRVIEVAPDVTHWKVGDRIATRATHRQYSVHHVGTADDDAESQGTRLSRVPQDMQDEEAAWFGMAYIAQLGVHAAEHKLGDAVVVVGMGLLGQLVTQYVRLMGAREIIVIDPAQPRLEMAKAHGATRALGMGVAEAREQVWEITGGRGADVVYDITGHPAVFSAALGLSRRFGKLILLGDAGTPSEQRLTPDVVTRGVRIIGAHDTHAPIHESEASRWTHKNITELFFTFLQRDQMRVSDLITHRYSPLEAPQAYDMLQTDRSGAMGVLFDWTKLS